jgi:hypothetical protein
MNKIIKLDEDYFVANTSFGKVVIERLEQKNPPISRTIVLDGVGKMFAQIRNNTDAIQLLYDHIKEKEKDQFLFTLSKEFMIFPDRVIIRGWQMNGTFFYEDTVKCDTVEKLLKHFLINAHEDFKLLPRFNQLVIIELIEQYFPESIIEHMKKFELLKFNDRIRQEFLAPR